MHYKNGKPYKKFKVLKDVVYFHYVYVKIPLRVKARFEISVEKGNLESENRYKRFESIKFHNDEDILKYAEDLEFINAMNGLNLYYGPHPEIIRDHPWRKIKDCREL